MMEVAHHDHVSNIVNLCAFQGWIQESIKEGAEVDLSGGGGGGLGASSPEKIFKFRLNFTVFWASYNANL